MKQTKKLMMLVLAAVLLVPASVNAAKVSIPGLYVAGEGNYDNSVVKGQVQYNGSKYDYYQVVSRPNCYYVPAIKGVYVTSCTVTGVLVESTKNYSGTLPLIVGGTVTVNTGSHKSCIRMYYGNLLITKPSNQSTATLKMNQTDDKKGMYASRGSITIDGITLNISTKKGQDNISQEAANGKLTFKDANVTCNNPIYAKGGLNMVGCCFKDGTMSRNNDGYVYEGLYVVKRTKAVSSVIVSTKRLKTMQNGIKVGKVTTYLADESKMLTMSDYSINGYPVVGADGSSFLGGVYYVPTKNAIYLDNATYIPEGEYEGLQSNGALTLYVRGDVKLRSTSRKLINCTSLTMYGVKNGSTLPTLSVNLSGMFVSKSGIDVNYYINYTADSEIHDVDLRLAGERTKSQTARFVGKNNCLLKLYDTKLYESGTLEFDNTQIVSFNCGFAKGENIKKEKWGQGFRFTPNTSLQIVNSNYETIDTRKTTARGW